MLLIFSGSLGLYTWAGSGAVEYGIAAPRYLLIGQSTVFENSKVLPDRARVAPTHFAETVLYKHPIRGKTNFRFFTFECTSFPEEIKSYNEKDDSVKPRLVQKSNSVS